MPDDAADRGRTGLGQRLRGSLFVRRLAQTDFYEFVAGQGFIQRTRDRLADPAFADEDDGLQGMGQAAKMPPLGTIKNRGGLLLGRILRFGHVSLSWPLLSVQALV